MDINSKKNTPQSEAPYNSQEETRSSHPSFSGRGTSKDVGTSRKISPENKALSVDYIKKAKVDYRISQMPQSNSRLKSLADQLRSTVTFEFDENNVKIKHRARQPEEKWNQSYEYGSVKDWEQLFERAVLAAVELIKDDNFSSKKLIEFCKSHRSEIAKTAKYTYAYYFSIDDRKDYDGCCTHIKGRYGYALSRVKELKDSQHYVADDYAPPDTDQKKCRTTIGKIGNNPIKLTCYELNYKSDDKGATRLDSAIWHHPCTPERHSAVPHIEQLVEKAIAGDLTQIPRIHWWYVQLAPVPRGPGGIAEMIVKSICRLHGFDLPAWKEGVAPSIEVLLQPDEEEFCRKYHTLFSIGQDILKNIFQPVATQPPYSRLSL